MDGWKTGIFGTSPESVIRPVENVGYNNIRGATNSNPAISWPVTGSSVLSSSFVGQLREKTGITGFDLPTEAQWEYACRAGTTTFYNDGLGTPANTTSNAQMDVLGRYERNGGKMWDDAKQKWDFPNQACGPENGTAIVGTYLPNAWGLYDMHGNVWEFCLDWYAASLAGNNDPAGAESGSLRVVRGGSWNYIGASCSSGSRTSLDPASRNWAYGFRLVVNLP